MSTPPEKGLSHEEACNILAQAASYFLKEDEGIFVETQNTKALVFYREGKVRLRDARDFAEFDVGKFIWLWESHVIQESDQRHWGFRKAQLFFKELPVEDRQALLDDYCVHCLEEKKGKLCYCMRDE